MIISPAATAELAEAFALLYGPTGDTAHAFRMVARGELDLDGLLVARRDGAIVGAVFVGRLPGNVAVIWPPRADSLATEDALTAAALEHVAGVKVVQAFLAPTEIGRAEPLLRSGFRHVTRVWQMDRHTSTGGEPGRVSAGGARTGKAQLQEETLPALARPGSPMIEVVAFADCDPAAFNATLLSAHEDSLDCPEFNQALTPNEVLAGYGDGTADDSRRYLATADSQPAGVLLLNGDELSFLGVVPECRNQGVGRRLLDVALDTTGRLLLIVDVRNGPAFQLYRAAGLEVVGAREVFLHFPVSAAGTTGTKARRS